MIPPHAPHEKLFVRLVRTIISTRMYEERQERRATDLAVGQQSSSE